METYTLFLEIETESLWEYLREEWVMQQKEAEFMCTSS